MGLELPPAACAALVDYLALLQRWNRVHNLTAVTDTADALSHHLLDCLAIVRPLQEAIARHAPALGRGGLDFLDAGSGGGLPGIPLALALPSWRGTLVDAVQKKCAFLQQVQLELRLTNIGVRHARLESIEGPVCDLVVARAFSSLRDLVDRTGALLRPGGLWAAMKGRRPDAEVAALPPGIEVLETITLRVPLLSEQRHLLVLRTAAPVPPGEPQR
jgi:16S rRNA (guanine527-N7)-methyltransferase